MSGSGVLDTLLEMWFVHKADMEAYAGVEYDADNQPIAAYADPVTLESCKLQDLSESEMFMLTEAGILNISKKLLVPYNVDPPSQTKISNIKTNGKDIEGIADVVIDNGIYEVVRTSMRRSTVDEYQQIYLKRLR